MSFYLIIKWKHWHINIQAQRPNSENTRRKTNGDQIGKRYQWKGFDCKRCCGIGKAECGITLAALWPSNLMTAGGRVVMVDGRYMCVYAWTRQWWWTRLHVGKNYGWTDGTCGQELRNCPTADTLACRQCLVHFIHGGGMLMFADLLPNVWCPCWDVWLK